MCGGCRFTCVTVLAALLVGPIGLVAQQRQDTQESLGKVEVLLTTAPSLSELARASMMSEAAGIWRQHGVLLDWLNPSAVRPVAPNRLRVLIVPKRLVARGALESVAVGELVQPADGHPVALISIESARHLISSVRGRAGYELITFDERRLGTVLGRALAHEIGHYLLDTHTHARSGLMRPNFDALEFTDLRNSTFALDHAASAWLRTRDEGKFAYVSK
jgi:hypothetical protein